MTNESYLLEGAVSQPGLPFFGNFIIAEASPKAKAR